MHSDLVHVVPSTRRRSWSAPPAPLSHLNELLEPLGNADGGVEDVISLITAVRAVGNPRVSAPPLIHLFPEGSYCAESPAERSPAPRNGNEKEAASTVTAPAPPEAATSYEEMKAALGAATSQIHLLNSTNEQTLRTYSSLEEENTRLRQLNEDLTAENHRLKEVLNHRQELVAQQSQTIRELQHQLEKAQNGKRGS